MKHRTPLRGMHALKSRIASTTPTVVRDDALPPPDPSTRVDTDLVPGTPLSRPAARRRSGELIVMAGLGGILIAVGSAFVKLVDLPSLAVLVIAGLGVVLMVMGALKYRTASHPSTGSVPAVAVLGAGENRPVADDLPSLTGQLGGMLAQLRQLHGMAYRSRTWIEDVLPANGNDLKNPALARDLLAVAALDAGGIRADVSGLVESHSRDEIVETGGALVEALHHVLVACEGSTDRTTQRPSDSSCWPASAW